jgi:hypothetical protein
MIPVSLPDKFIEETAFDVHCRSANKVIGLRDAFAFGCTF